MATNEIRKPGIVNNTAIPEVGGSAPSVPANQNVSVAIPGGSSFTTSAKPSVPLAGGRVGNLLFGALPTLTPRQHAFVEHVTEALGPSMADLAVRGSHVAGSFARSLQDLVG